MIRVDNMLILCRRREAKKDGTVNIYMVILYCQIYLIYVDNMVQIYYLY